MATVKEARDSFSFIIIPDTQKLAAYYPDIYEAMASSVVKHAKEIGAGAVLHLGDVVDNGAVDERQYKVASSALSQITGADIPLLIAPGNHDYDIPIVSANGRASDAGRRRLTMFNRYFGTHRIQREDWFGGEFEPGMAENMYALIESGGLRIVLLVLEFAPRDEVMKWADVVMRQHQDRKVIVITHSYMYMYGERIQAQDSANPKTKYFAGVGCNDGEDMWSKYLKQHPNLVAVFSGHHIPVTTSYRVDRGEHGNRVIQMFQNWQSEHHGGSGRYRIVHYNAEVETMTFQVFNPMTQQFETEPDYALCLACPAQAEPLPGRPMLA